MGLQSPQPPALHHAIPWQSEAVVAKSCLSSPCFRNMLLELTAQVVYTKSFVTCDVSTC